MRGVFKSVLKGAKRKGDMKDMCKNTLENAS